MSTHRKDGMDNGNIIRELSSWKAFVLKIYYLACFVYNLVYRQLLCFINLRFLGLMEEGREYGERF